jgi:hypothetical protein
VCMGLVLVRYQRSTQFEEMQLAHFNIIQFVQPNQFYC